MKDRGKLLTEPRNPRSTQIDHMPSSAAFDLLEQANGRVKTAWGMHNRGVDDSVAQRRLHRVDGRLMQILPPVTP